MGQIKVNRTLRTTRDLKAGGAIRLKGATVPPDASIAPGEFVLYGDPTNGAGKLKIKGKTLNGTVVSGTVNLA